MTEDLSTYSVLREWQFYLQRANAISATISQELHALFEPWPVKQSPSKQRLDPRNETEPENNGNLPPPSAEEEMVLNQVNRGLRKASRAREKAVKNLLPEIGAVSEDTEVIVEDQKTKDSLSFLPEAGVDKNGEEVAVVSESALKDLVQKYMTHPVKEVESNSSLQKRKTKVSSIYGNLMNSRASSSGRDASSKKSTSKTVLKVPRPVSQHQRSMYTTSSSVIGKGLSSSQKSKGERIGVSSAHKKSYQRPAKSVHLEENARSVLAPKIGGKSDTRRTDRKARSARADGHSGKESTTLDLLKARQNGSTTEISGCEMEPLKESLSRDDNSAKSRLDELRSDLVSESPSSETPDDTKLHSFDLLKDGKSIHIPVSLKKQLASNWKWRHKIMQHSKFKSSKATVFLETVASSSSENQDLLYSEMLKEYEYLSEMATQTYKELEGEKGTAPSNSEKYEKCHKLYQEILNKWKNIGERKQSLESGNGIPSRETPADFIRYESLKQLEKYTELQLQVQVLEFQLELQRALSDELIPYLKKLDPADERFSSVFRKIKGLLCFGGETFPSLVRYEESDEDDSIGDDEDGNEEEEQEEDDDVDTGECGNDVFHGNSLSSAVT